MRFSEVELRKRVKKGLHNLTPKEEIDFNILNFIHCIHLNKQDFYSERFDSKFYGEIEMTFKKSHGSLIGHCRVKIAKENRVTDYLFTENGYELLRDVVRE